MVGNNIVIPSRTPGVAEITSVRNKGMWGNPDLQSAMFCICALLVARFV